MPMVRSSRNLKRLMVLTVAMLLVLAIAMVPEAAMLGVTIVFAGVVYSACAWASPLGEFAFGSSVRQPRNVAPDFQDTGQGYQLMPDGVRGVGSHGSYFVNSGVPPSGRIRKNHFVVSMAFHGDRICTGSVLDNATEARGAPVGDLLPFVSNAFSYVTTQFGQSDSTAPGFISALSNDPCSTELMTTMRASPAADASARIGKLLDFGLMHYRARDRGMVLGLAA